MPLDFSKQQYREGARLLAELLPKAKAMVATTIAEPRTELAKATMPHLREDNLQAVMIYSPPTGGWIADVVCKEVPPGIANVFGTPVGEPLVSREEAYDSAVRTLAIILSMASKPQEVQEPVFEYYDVSFNLNGQLLKYLSDHGAAYPSVEHAYTRLREVTQQLFPDGYKYEQIAVMPQEQIRWLMSIAHMAAVTSVLRYPPLIPAAPANRTPH